MAVVLLGFELSSVLLGHSGTPYYFHFNRQSREWNPFLSFHTIVSMMRQIIYSFCFIPLSITHFFPLILLKAFHMTLTPTLHHCCFDFYFQCSEGFKSWTLKDINQYGHSGMFLLFTTNIGICLVISKPISDITNIGLSNIKLFSPQALISLDPVPGLWFSNGLRAALGSVTELCLYIKRYWWPKLNKTTHSQLAANYSTLTVFYWTIHTQNRSKRLN